MEKFKHHESKEESKVVTLVRSQSDSKEPQKTTKTFAKGSVWPLLETVGGPDVISAVPTVYLFSPVQVSVAAAGCVFVRPPPWGGVGGPNNW